VNLVSFGELQQLVTAHGYWAVALIVGLESMGLPLPGETRTASGLREEFF
jgi:membrane protein DedA with SNARE-associated domain